MMASKEGPIEEKVPLDSSMAKKVKLIEGTKSENQDNIKKNQNDLITNLQKMYPKGVSKVEPPSKADLDEYREKLGVLHKHTVAVGRVDVPGLEGLAFTGASIGVRKDAKLKSLDEVATDRPIKSPATHPLGKAHAEEGVIAEFVSAVNATRLRPEQVKGILYIPQSNPSGVCPTCIQGLAKRKDEANCGSRHIPTV